MTRKYSKRRGKNKKKFKGKKGKGGLGAGWGGTPFQKRVNAAA